MGDINFTAAFDLVSEKFISEQYNSVRKAFIVKTQGTFVKKHVITLCIYGKMNNSKSNKESEIKNTSNMYSIAFFLKIEENKLKDIISDIDGIKIINEEFCLKIKDKESKKLILDRLNSMIVMFALE